MGTWYYLIRDDNRTAFSLTKAYAMASLLGDFNRTDEDRLPPVDMSRDNVMRLVTEQFGQWPEYAPHLDAIADRMIAFADGHPVRFVDEHSNEMDPHDGYKTVDAAYRAVPKWANQDCH